MRIFTGLSERQRREICLEADLEETAKFESLMAVGEIGVRIFVILTGRCAIYTMRGQIGKPLVEKKQKDQEDAEQKKQDVDLKVDLREK